MGTRLNPTTAPGTARETNMFKATIYHDGKCIGNCWHEDPDGLDDDVDELLYACGLTGEDVEILIDQL